MKAKQQSRYTLFDELIASKANFAIYRLPAEKDIHLILQTDPQPAVYDDLTSVDIQNGFLVAPFCSNQVNRVIVIQPDVCLNGEGEIFNYLENFPLTLPLPEESQKTVSGVPASTSNASTFEHYQQAYQKFHSHLNDQTFEKLVLSRTLDVPLPTDFSAGKVFDKACQKYPDNFIYLLHHQACGTWLGCSPEIIVAGEGQQWKTDALAGTQAIPESQQQIEWDAKNQREQQIVVEYMQQQLATLDIASNAQAPRTIRSGNLVHLRSEVNFQLTNPSQIFNVLNILHPSPAVCGVPKKQAFDFITQNEGYNRAYYSGIVGRLDAQNKTDLYVNLRCMQIFDNYLKLYAGGGILASSKLESEWQETQHKLQTVRSLLG